VVAIIEGSATTWAKAYSQGVGEKMPNASQSVERFYVMQLFSRATDKVRCAERRKADGKQRMLTGIDYVWLKGEENLTEHHRANSST
jgi:transposase